MEAGTGINCYIKTYTYSVKNQQNANFGLETHGDLLGLMTIESNDRRVKS